MGVWSTFRRLSKCHPSERRVVGGIVGTHYLGWLDRSKADEGLDPNSIMKTDTFNKPKLGQGEEQVLGVSVEPISIDQEICFS